MPYSQELSGTLKLIKVVDNTLKQSLKIDGCHTNNESIARDQYGFQDKFQPKNGCNQKWTNYM